MLKLLTLDSNIFISETKGMKSTAISIKAGAKRVTEVETIVSSFITCDREFCKKAGITGVQYGIYSTDSLYLQTALDSYSILVSLDKDEFILKLKDKNLPIEVYHPEDFPY